MIEPGLAIIAGNLAVLRPLWITILRARGIRTISTGSHLTGIRFPPTVAAQDKSKGRQDSRDTFLSMDILTMEIEDADQAKKSIDGKNQNRTAITRLSNQPNSVWVSRQQSNESQEELHPYESK